MRASDWAGRIGETWAEEWPRTDRSFAPVDAALVAAALVEAGLAGDAAPCILDVGCGAGRTSLSLAEAMPGAAVTGIDLSPALIAAAAERTGGQPRCRFAQGDATRWAAERDFDLVVSRHGVMFFDDPVAAFAHLRTLAKPGAPLVFSCFRSPRENVWASALAHLMPALGDPHAPGPFAFADEARVAGILAAADWRDAAAQPLDFGYVAGAGEDPVADAIGFFRRIGPVARALRDLDRDGRARLAAALDTLVRDHRDGDRIVFPAAAWIWRARA